MTFSQLAHRIVWLAGYPALAWCLLYKGFLGGYLSDGAGLLTAAVLICVPAGLSARCPESSDDLRRTYRCSFVIVLLGPILCGAAFLVAVLFGNLPMGR